MSDNPYSSPATAPQDPSPRSPWRGSTYFAISLVSMLIWPALGALAGNSVFESPSEAVFLFGGISAILFLPVYFLFPMSETVFGFAVILMWLFVWILGSTWATSAKRSRYAQVVLLIVMSTISLGQCLLGLLMLLSRSI